MVVATFAASVDATTTVSDGSISSFAASVDATTTVFDDSTVEGALGGVGNKVLLCAYAIKT